MTTQSAELARSITRASSKQSYYTARLMVDQSLENDCYRAYGYFRWVDDMVDIECQTKEARLAFIQRQKDLVELLYRAETLTDLTSEEEIIADLICNDHGKSNRLRSYIRNFLAVIEFDADRKDRLITQHELDWYAATLGKAVTDGIQYFVCNTHPYPESENRYQAATGAHIAHMLRDMVEDISEGYINIPLEKIEELKINPMEIDSVAMRTWVEERVQLARLYFKLGKQYLNELSVLRCRIVGYWYCARFENLLNTIEKDNYILRSVYPKPDKLITWLKFVGIALVQIGRHSVYHLKKGFSLCGWPQKSVEHPMDTLPEYE